MFIYLIAAVIILIISVILFPFFRYSPNRIDEGLRQSDVKITDVIHDFYDWEKGDDLYMLDWHYGTYQGILDDRRIVVKRPDGQMERMDPFHSKIPFSLVNRSTRLRREEKRSTETERQLEESRLDDFMEAKKQALRELNDGNRLTNTS